MADNKTGYFGVTHRPGYSKPYEARVRRGGKQVSLGHFATAEEAALCIARSPEGREAAKMAAAPPLLTSKVGRRDARSLRRKELLGRWEQVLTALGARLAEEEAAEEAAAAAAEAEAETARAALSGPR